MKSKKIGFIGAYERDNFGDILFLYVTKKILNEEAGLSGEPLSIVSSAMTECLDGLKVKSYNKYSLREYNILFSVGGEIINCTTQQALKMSLPSTYSKEKDLFSKISRDYFGTKGIGIDDLAYIPTAMDFKEGELPAIIINSAGGSGFNYLPEGTKKKAIATMKSSKYISVRDPQTQRLLKEHGIHSELYPDIVHYISNYLKFKNNNDRDYIVFQCSKLYIDHKGHKAIASKLYELATKYSKKIVFLEAGRASGHDDYGSYEKIISLMDSGFKHEIFEKRNALEIVKLIAGAYITITTSLHCRIVSEAYSVPRVSLKHYIGNDMVGDKTSKYAAYWDSDYPFESELEDLLSNTDKSLKLVHVNRLKPLLAKNIKKFISVINGYSSVAVEDKYKTDLELELNTIDFMRQSAIESNRVMNCDQLEIDKFKKRTEDLEAEIKSKNMNIKNLKDSNIDIGDELRLIKNSRRYKIANILADFLNILKTGKFLKGRK
jgi:hypothetical protein